MVNAGIVLIAVMVVVVKVGLIECALCLRPVVIVVVEDTVAVRSVVNDVEEAYRQLSEVCLNLQLRSVSA